MRTGFAFLGGLFVATVAFFIYSGFFGADGIRETQGISGELIKTTLKTVVVERVIDGDTVELSDGSRVRLVGINTPEKGQKYYSQAVQRLQDLVEGQEAGLEKLEDEDKYGRILGFLKLGDLNINVELVKDGLATVFILQEGLPYEGELRNAWKACLERGVNLCSSSDNLCGSGCIEIAEFEWNSPGNDCENLNEEYVSLRNNCPFECSMESWEIRDESSQAGHIFSGVVLDERDEVRLYSGCGENSQSEQYWCRKGGSCTAVWNNDGDTLFLRDSQGGLILSSYYGGFDSG